MTPEEQFLAHLDVIERVLRFICRKNFLRDSEAEEFCSSAKVKLIENDYAILRKFEGKSTLSTYLAVVLQRMYLDYADHLWGRWRPSSAAKRLGTIAIQLECALHRDRKSFDEAFEEIRRLTPISREELQALHLQLPARPPRATTVGLDDVEVPLQPDALQNVEQRQAMRIATAADRSITRIIEELDPEDRLILRMRFADAIPIVDIARALRIDDRALYKRIDKLLRSLRRRLEHEGVDREQARAILDARLDLAFGSALLENTPPRPSMEKVSEGFPS